MENKTSAVPIPDRMAHLPKDSRGYPIPAFAMIGSDGKPSFITHDKMEVQRLIAHDQCSLCGQPLLRGRWFAGGPQSAFHPRGGYVDPGMHYECVEYAMKVCPWLAMPGYRKRIENKQKIAGAEVVEIMEGAIAEKPAVFVAVMAVGQTLAVNPLFGHVESIAPKRPYRIVEFWKDGKRLKPEDGMGLAASVIHPQDMMKCFDSKTVVRYNQEGDETW